MKIIYVIVVLNKIIDSLNISLKRRIIWQVFFCIDKVYFIHDLFRAKKSYSLKNQRQKEIHISSGKDGNQRGVTPEQKLSVNITSSVVDYFWEMYLDLYMK